MKRVKTKFIRKQNQQCCSLRILLTSAANLKASKKGKRSSKLSSLGFDIQVGKAIPFSMFKNENEFTLGLCANIPLYRSNATGLLSMRHTLFKSFSASVRSFKKLPFLTTQDYRRGSISHVYSSWFLTCRKKRCEIMLSWSSQSITGSAYSAIDAV